MSSDRDSSGSSSTEELLPDERAAIAERFDSLDDDASHLTIEQVAEDLGIDLDDDSA